MKDRLSLTFSSLLSILLFSLHWADEVARGLEPGTIAAFGGILILAVWLCATVVFGDKRLGVAVIRLASLLAAGVPVLHMLGRGLVNGRYATNANLLFWVWTNVALGATGILSVVLSVRVLWALSRHGSAATAH